jgi:hypothetical protein
MINIGVQTAATTISTTLTRWQATIMMSVIVTLGLGHMRP